MIFHHLGRLFLVGTLKNVACSLNELLVNIERNVVALADFPGSNFQRMANWSSFDEKNRNWENCTEHAQFREESGVLGRFCRLDFQRMGNRASFDFLKIGIGRIVRNSFHPVSILKKSERGQLAIRWNFEPEKSANHTRFL